MSVILVVAAHPDDEVLGVGATIARRIAEGDQAFALILGEGQTSRWESRKEADQEAVRLLHKDSIEAARIIGYEDIYFVGLPDNRFDQVGLLEVVKLVEKAIEKIRPNVIYTHHGHDLNIDHQITFEAVLTATRPLRNCAVHEIYAFETVSSTEWSFGKKEDVFYPNVFIDISKFFEIKSNAMKKYRTEICGFPHPRSLEMLEAVARRWGGVVGKEYVEAFELIRKVD